MCFLKLNQFSLVRIYRQLRTLWQNIVDKGHLKIACFNALFELAPLVVSWLQGELVVQTGTLLETDSMMHARRTLLRCALCWKALPIQVDRINFLTRISIYTLAIGKIISVKNARAWVSMVSYLKKYMKIKILKRKKK